MPGRAPPRGDALSPPPADRVRRPPTVSDEFKSRPLCFARFPTYERTNEKTTLSGGSLGSRVDEECGQPH